MAEQPRRIDSANPMGMGQGRAMACGLHMGNPWVCVLILSLTNRFPPGDWGFPEGRSAILRSHSGLHAFPGNVSVPARGTVQSRCAAPRKVEAVPSCARVRR
jgi:hypothetical protein